MTDTETLKLVKEYWINKISAISPSCDFESYMYQLFLRFASLEELEGNYVLYSTLKKIDTYQELQNEDILKFAKAIYEQGRQDESELYVDENY